MQRYIFFYLQQERSGVLIRQKRNIFYQKQISLKIFYCKEHKYLLIVVLRGKM